MALEKTKILLLIFSKIRNEWKRIIKYRIGKNKS
jgi:hypothetical protein